MKQFNTTWIIDDDQIQVFLAKRILTNMEFSQNVMAINNAKKAVEELHELSVSKNSELPDIIFVDINMPQMDGWQFLEEYDKMSLEKKVVIYLMTSSIDPQDVKKAGTYNFVNGYLIKPLKKEDIQEILNNY